MMEKLKILNKKLKTLNKKEDKILSEISDIINEFIKGELIKLVKLFPDIKAIHIYDGFDSTHQVHILPIKTHQDNKDYINWELDMIDKFVYLIPTHNIYFTSDEEHLSDSDLKNTIFEIKGNKYLN